MRWSPKVSEPPNGASFAGKQAQLRSCRVPLVLGCDSLTKTMCQKYYNNLTILLQATGNKSCTLAGCAKWMLLKSVFKHSTYEAYRASFADLITAAGAFSPIAKASLMPEIRTSGVKGLAIWRSAPASKASAL